MNRFFLLLFVSTLSFSQVTIIDNRPKPKNWKVVETETSIMYYTYDFTGQFKLVVLKEDSKEAYQVYIVWDREMLYCRGYRAGVVKFDCYEIETLYYDKVKDNIVYLNPKILTQLLNYDVMTVWCKSVYNDDMIYSFNIRQLQSFFVTKKDNKQEMK